MRKRRRSPLPVLISLALVVFIALIASYFFQKTSVNDTVADKTKYFGITSAEEVPLIVDDQLLGEKGLVKDGVVYLDYHTVYNELTKAMYYEAASARLFVTLPSGTAVYTPDDGTGALILEGDVPYLSVDFIRENADIELEVLQDPIRVVARTTWQNLKTATATENTEVRASDSTKSEILTELAAGDAVVLLENGDKWDRVSTMDGYQGYVEKDKLAEADGVLTHTTDEKFVFPKISLDYKINMSWMYVQSFEGNDQLDVLTENATGLNTISPTWFSLANAEGDLTSYAEADYVSKAHEKGLQVWGCFQDVYGDQVSIGDVLSTYEKRQHVISQLLQACTDTGMDGINIDIETITEDTAPQYLQFIKELCVAAHAQNVIVSTDAYVPKYTGYYDRGEQAKTVDYLVIMGYDEHTASSEEPGSVASLGFVEEGIKDTLKEVPASQVINAIPFYSRGWTELFTQDGLISEAYGMDGAKKFAEDHNISLSWDTETGQNYGTAKDDKGRYSIWIEDAASIAEKMKLIQKYDLAGVAEWRLGLESPDVWSVIQEYLQ